LKKLPTIFVFLIITGCSQYTVLKNGYSKVPANNEVFKNKMYFEKSILLQIDTTVIYEEYKTNYYKGFEKQPDILYRFYGNGCYNLFHLDRNKPELTKEMFDPNYAGIRGVLYKKKEKILGDKYTQIGQSGRQLGMQTDELTFNGDTLIVELEHVHKDIYIKRKIDPNLPNHNAKW
jgi:hypothetical protein